ncbi:peptide-methionine (S)-S-oxide reductase MsrA [Cyanobacterium sp. IPPAS B-1200]|uniref:peptide-methionine (S)-S-oxide reductase MsrA n=1 Tax=Cyanobacterium sp. IPPAS B-1200 TaxID=1562720 RepID=UPI00085268F2|nr:peptide-methionine (S)-S-oxide reductase MsrA [Cyanobacterium sp. IPPAS B-1200]OEJ79551.1 peptide-methionine (S)-S-oxide reductase [Cyanobacterium sp. IPPAS B-1200]
MFLFGLGDKKLSLPKPEEALKGRDKKMPLPSKHFVNGNSFKTEYPANMEKAVFGMGCFWGAERKFWQLETGIYLTAVGYAAGYTPNPTYEEVCSGLTGHNEVVLVVYDPQIISYETLLKVFWENHNPTQGMRQGNDRGTQYRSGIYTYSAQQKELAQKSKQLYQQELNKAGLEEITTEILDAPEFYFAEGYHQQYLAKNPNGYCGLGGTKVSFPEISSVKN